MRLTAPLAVALAAGLALSGCATADPDDATISSPHADAPVTPVETPESGDPIESPEAEEPEEAPEPDDGPDTDEAPDAEAPDWSWDLVDPAAVVMSLHSLQVIEGDGSKGPRVKFSEGDKMVDLMTELLGRPDHVENRRGQGKVGYEWDEVAVVVDSQHRDSMVVFWTALVDGIELRTLDNLEVGDSRADVISLDPIPLWSKGEGEDAGEPDGYCLQSENVPDTQSLFRPGHGGIDCVRVTVEDDVVGTIRSPWGDWHDV